MKKWVLLLLCLAMLLLPACQKATITPPTGSDGDYQEWNAFIWRCKWGHESSFVMLRSTEDGKQDKITVSYNGEKYSISDSSGTRYYNYLIWDNHAEEIDGGYSYGDYYFLTDDANMTFRKYQQALSSPLNDHMQLLLPTELVLAKTDVSDCAQVYGKTPKQIQAVLHPLTKEEPIYFGKDSFFTLDFVGPYFIDYDPEDLDIFHLVRYDYAGNRLCSLEVPHPGITNISEFDDGSFIFFSRLLGDDPGQIFYYNASGDLRWSYRFPFEQNLHISHIFRTDDYFYCFGVNEAMNTDIYIAKFSLGGQLVKEMMVGGSGYDGLEEVVISGENFTVFGSTESSDGSFPLSQDGNRVFFKAELSSEMTLADAKALTSDPSESSHCGFIGNLEIFKNDTLLLTKEADRLPEKAYVVAVFTWDGGYVILRQLLLERYAFTSPSISMGNYYQQLIATHYNNSGEPVWQTVTAPYLR